MEKKLIEKLFVIVTFVFTWSTYSTAQNWLPFVEEGKIWEVALVSIDYDDNEKGESIYSKTTTFFSYKTSFFSCNNKNRKRINSSL